jgi:hypothetical protein
MKISKIESTFGRNSKNCIDKTIERNLKGALACLETFYYSFNNKDLNLFKQIWLNHELIQLNNPLGGIVRGIIPIGEMYEKIFNGQADVWVELTNIVCYHSQDMIVFAGKEIGEFSSKEVTLDLQIRTSRIFRYDKKENRWFQVHHHGSIDDAKLLDIYQKTVKK